MTTPHEERLIEAVARAINRGSFNFHSMDSGEEERMWKETQMVRLAQARAAIEAYRNYDERR